jgi:hypothetical protein
MSAVDFIKSYVKFVDARRIMNILCRKPLTCGIGGLRMLNYNDDNKGDNVNHPAYYTDGKIEVSDFIADKNLNFFRGNVVKYVARAGKKDPAREVEDLKKAAWYIGREIERLERKA